MELLNVELEQESILETLSELAVNVGISDEIKQALLQCFEHVAWIDGQGQTYYDALYDALYPPVELDSITCVYTQGGTVYDTDTLDSLKSDLVVTAHYSDQSTETITTYTLSGTLAEGTSTITVTYMGKTTTFDVTVTSYWTLDWDYTKGTPVGQGFEHSSTVVGTMESDAYKMQGSSSGGCNLILSENGDATKGVTEIVFNLSAVRNAYIGLHFDVKNFWFYIANNDSGYKTYYFNKANTPAASTVTQIGTFALNTDYKIRAEWDANTGASLYINDVLAYSVTSMQGTNRTRWFLSTDNNATVAHIKSIKVRIES